MLYSLAVVTSNVNLRHGEQKESSHEKDRENSAVRKLRKVGNGMREWFRIRRADNPWKDAGLDRITHVWFWSSLQWALLTLNALARWLGFSFIFERFTVFLKKCNICFYYYLYLVLLSFHHF